MVKKTYIRRIANFTNITTGIILYIFFFLFVNVVNTYGAEEKASSLKKGDTLQVMYCNEFITLRMEPNTAAGELTRMPLGANAIYLSSAENEFYQVEYQGITGYALAQYLEKADMYEKNASGLPENSEVSSQNGLRIDMDPFLYTYEDMLFDIEKLEEQYPKLLTVENLGTTIDDRVLYMLRIGKEDAPNKVLIHAGIHAREYITCQLVMKQTSEILKDLDQNLDYKSHKLNDLLDQVALYVIPMVNPDGISISQLGIAAVKLDSTRERLEQIASADGKALTSADYLTSWKANANGVDLNRNFDALWEKYAGAGHISCDHYKGTSIGCEVESKALIDLTEKYKFDRTISYHTQGDVIYWYFAQEEPLYSATYTFAKRLGAVTGYPLDANYQSLDPAGYKDWCVHKMDIPSVTIETGLTTSPVPAAQFPGIWRENQNVFQETMLDVLENPYKPGMHENAIEE